MSKSVRKAVRCFVIKDNKVVVIKYKEGNKKEGYYDIPGGKIEDGELPEQTAIREMKEETGLDIKNPKHEGRLVVEYPDRVIDFEVYLVKDYDGDIQESEENTCEVLDIDNLLKKEKILALMLILDKFFIKGLIDDNYSFKMSIKVDENEDILDIKYNLNEIK